MSIKEEREGLSLFPLFSKKKVLICVCDKKEGKTYKFMKKIKH
jgi:hypothetical protein